jgi:hypothetical protein
MSKDRIQSILDKVNSSRRGFLKQVLMGGGAVAALAIPASRLHAEEAAGRVGQKKGDDGATGATGGTGKKGKKGKKGEDKKDEK